MSKCRFDHSWRERSGEDLAGPDAQRAVEAYRREASTYERTTRRSGTYRVRAVELLGLRPGETVLDVACGSGLGFEPIERAIGRSGRLVGIDVSPDMLGIARRRVESCGYENVTLCECRAEDLQLEFKVDAVLFSLAHDVLRSEDAIDAVLRHLRPGARIAAFGAKRAPAWIFPVRLSVRRRARRYITTFEGFDRPWDKLERAIPGLMVKSVAFGSAFLASATVEPDQIPRT